MAPRSVAPDLADTREVAPKTERTSQICQQRPNCDAVLSTLAGMGNMGKVRRVVREAVAVLVEELGSDGAARLLERAAAQLRGTAYKPDQIATREEKPAKGRPRTAANG